MDTNNRKYGRLFKTYIYFSVTKNDAQLQISNYNTLHGEVAMRRPIWKFCITIRNIHIS